MRLRWRDVDLLTGFITIRETKNNKGRSVPINTVARAALVELGSRRRHPDDAGEWVFDPRPTQADFFAKAVLTGPGDLRDALRTPRMTVGFTWHAAGILGRPD